MEIMDTYASNSACGLCGSQASLLYADLVDRLTNGDGAWSIYRCTSRQCGLAWIDPKPSAAQLSAAYMGYYTHDNSQGNSWFRRQYERLRSGYLASKYGYPAGNIKPWEKFAGQLLAFAPHRRAAFDASVMWLPARQKGKLLEIGCGNGSLMARLADLGWLVQGIEPDTIAADMAISRGLPVIIGKLDALSFVAGSFDAIIMSHVIEHVDDPVALVRQCRRILKPGGRLVMLTPNLDALGHRWFGRNWLHLDAPRHLHLFTQGSLPDICRKAGFSDIVYETSVRDANWTLAASLSLRYKNKYRLGKLPGSLRIVGMILLYMEWLGILLRLSQGEELLVIASHGKPAAQSKNPCNGSVPC